MALHRRAPAPANAEQTLMWRDGHSSVLGYQDAAQSNRDLWAAGRALAGAPSDVEEAPVWRDNNGELRAAATPMCAADTEALLDKLEEAEPLDDKVREAMRDAIYTNECDVNLSADMRGSDAPSTDYDASGYAEKLGLKKTEETATGEKYYDEVIRPMFDKVREHVIKRQRTHHFDWPDNPRERQFIASLATGNPEADDQPRQGMFRR